MDKEEQFFEEIKPLLQDYVEFTKEDMSQKWEDMEKEALAKVEESRLKFAEAEEKRHKALEDSKIFSSVMPKLKMLGEEVYKPVEIKQKENIERLKENGREYNARQRELEQAYKDEEQIRTQIEQEKQERVKKQKEKQESVYAKAKEHIASSKEKMKQDIKEKQDKLEEVKKQQETLEKEKEYALKLKLSIQRKQKEMKDSEVYKKIYKAANEESKKSIEVLKEHSKVVSQAERELEEAQATLVSFEKTYDAIDFTTEAGIQSLIEITGWKEEKEVGEQGKDTEAIDNEMEATLEAEEENKEPKGEQQEEIEQLKREEMKEIFEETEKGFEDLRSPEYLVNKYKVLGMKNVDEAMKIVSLIKGKTLLGIYMNLYDGMEKDAPTKRKLKELIEKVEKRTERLKDNNRKGENLSPKEMAEIEAEAGAQDCLLAALELTFANMEEGFKDLLSESYMNETSQIMENAKKGDRSEAEQVLMKMCNMTLKDFLKKQIEEAKRQGGSEKIPEIQEMLNKVVAREKEIQQGRKKTAEQKAAAQKTAEQKTAEQKAAAQKTAEQKAAAQKAAEQKKAEQKAAAQKAAEQKAAAQKVTEPKTTEQQPSQTQSGTSQILQPGQEEQVEMPIERIKIDSNKGKVFVYLRDGREDEPKEYDIKEILSKKKDILWEVETNTRINTMFNERGMTQKEIKAILESANIFVLKALVDDKIGDKINEKTDYQMLKTYLCNIDIVNNITRASDAEQMRIPTIMHNLGGKTLKKRDYIEVVRNVEKDKGIKGAQFDQDAMIELPKTWKERLPIRGIVAVGHGIATIAGKIYTGLENRARNKAENEEEKVARKEQKAEADRKKSRERGAERARKNRKKAEERAERKEQKAAKREKMEDEFSEVDGGTKNTQTIQSAKEQADDRQTKTDFIQQVDVDHAAAMADFLRKAEELETRETNIDQTNMESR